MYLFHAFPQYTILLWKCVCRYVSNILTKNAVWIFQANRPFTKVLVWAIMNFDFVVTAMKEWLVPRFCNSCFCSFKYFNFSYTSLLISFKLAVLMWYSLYLSPSQTSVLSQCYFEMQNIWTVSSTLCSLLVFHMLLPNFSISNLFIFYSHFPIEMYPQEVLNLWANILMEICDDDINWVLPDSQGFLR